MEKNSKVENYRLFSFVSEITEDGIEKVSQNIQNIIKYNLEREEKEALFNDKVGELKLIFEKQNLKNLKNLKFDLINSLNIELENEQEEHKRPNVVGERED